MSLWGGQAPALPASMPVLVPVPAVLGGRRGVMATSTVAVAPVRVVVTPTVAPAPVPAPVSVPAPAVLGAYGGRVVTQTPPVRPALPVLTLAPVAPTAALVGAYDKRGVVVTTKMPAPVPAAPAPVHGGETGQLVNVAPAAVVLGAYDKRGVAVTQTQVPVPVCPTPTPVSVPAPVPVNPVLSVVPVATPVPVRPMPVPVLALAPVPVNPVLSVVPVPQLALPVPPPVAVPQPMYVPTQKSAAQAVLGIYGGRIGMGEIKPSAPAAPIVVAPVAAPASAPAPVTPVAVHAVPIQPTLYPARPLDVVPGYMVQLPVPTTDCRGLKKCLNHAMLRGTEISEYVDSNRDHARGMGIESIGAEISMLLECDGIGRLKDTLADGGATEISEEGLSRLHRLGRLVADADVRFSGAQVRHALGYATATASPDYLPLVVVSGFVLISGIALAFLLKK